MHARCRRLSTARNSALCHRSLRLCKPLCMSQPLKVLPCALPSPANRRRLVARNERADIQQQSMTVHRLQLHQHATSAAAAELGSRQQWASAIVAPAICAGCAGAHIQGGVACVGALCSCTADFRQQHCATSTYGLLYEAARRHGQPAAASCTVDHSNSEKHAGVMQCAYLGLRRGCEPAPSERRPLAIAGGWQRAAALARVCDGLVKNDAEPRRAPDCADRLRGGVAPGAQPSRAPSRSRLPRVRAGLQSRQQVHQATCFADARNAARSR